MSTQHPALALGVRATMHVSVVVYLSVPAMPFYTHFAANCCRSLRLRCYIDESVPNDPSVYREHVWDDACHRRVAPVGLY